MGSIESLETPGFRIFRLVHRLAVFCTALWYVVISIQAFFASMSVLRGQELEDLGFELHSSTLIAGYAGTTTINESPLVQQVLAANLEPRNDSLYLESTSTYSFSGCTGVDKFDANLYSNTFLRFIFRMLQTHATYNLTYVAELELVAPVVDCTFDLLVSGDKTAARVYYLVRRRTAPTEMLLLSTSLSAQDYEVDQQYQSGAGVLVSIAAIEDMRATELAHNLAIALNYPYETEPSFTYCEVANIETDNFWLLRNFPDNMNLDPIKDVRTARQIGGYIDDPVAQSNINNAHWELSSDPATELSQWQWHVKAILHDSWAWTHAIHGIFALDIFFNLGVLLFVIYRRLRLGHVWVGDAFATISNALLYRGVLVVVSNHLNGYWTLTEFCLAIGHNISGRQEVYYLPELAHADLLTFFLNMTSILSYVARERIDPLLAFATFEFGFVYRIELAQGLTGLKQIIVDFADADYWLGYVQVGAFLDSLSPMGFWTIHAITTDRKRVVASTVIAIFSPMMVLVFYIIARKAFRFFSRHEQEPTNRRSSMYSNDKLGATPHDEEEPLTSFETATGAALSKRFGVISGYDNYVLRDGERFASIDAVYGNGFLLANGKFLVATEDLQALLLMKLTRVRFTNIFIYEIVANGGVNQTARLMYPQTIPWSDLARLGVTKLS
ncbi:hypothetical protein BBJ28_00010782 [Nothophytophthora sp. Chile5]|nr:hypothetical protein BBJ28_00010782 [Nothophytophthora sp. Chile5]